jgi:hypothetical protein
LEKYNFEAGGYTLVGVFEHHDDHSVQKAVGEFYTDNISVLNAIKRAWNFPRTQAMHACGYHYFISLLRNGKRVDGFSINLDCNEIITEKGARFFDSTLLTKFSTSLAPLIARHSEFSTIGEARRYWEQSNADKYFVFAYEPKWLKYEGSFRFRVPCPESNKACYTLENEKIFVEQIRKNIESAFPAEKFDLKPSGGSSAGEIFVEITCNRSLESKFTIYDRWDKEHFGKWAPFSLALYTFWKK